MSLADKFWAGPPVSRTWAAAVAIISLSAHLEFVSPMLLVFWPGALLRFPPELWRLITSFCFTMKLGIILTPFMIWTTAGALERDSPRFKNEPGKFLLYLIFIAVTTLCINSYFLGSFVFTSPLTLAVTYTYCQENHGQQASVFGFPMKAQYVWLAYLGITFLSNGQYALFEELGGVVAAHLYDFLTLYWPAYGGGINVLPTPRFLASLFNEASPQPGSSGPVASAAGRNDNQGWGGRGVGRRLGG